MKYIAGFVAKKMFKVISCDICVEACVDNNWTVPLIDFVNRGGLIKPSKDVLNSNLQKCRKKV